MFKQNDPSLNFNVMEKDLAKEMARLKIYDAKKKREIEKTVAESDEIKELQAKIAAAKLNKERNSQVSEAQYRRQVELVSNPFLIYFDRNKTHKSRWRC